MWPIRDVNSNDIPRCSGTVVHVVRKPGTALGMSIAGGQGSMPFIGNDEVTSHSVNSVFRSETRVSGENGVYSFLCITLTNLDTVS